MEFPDCSLSLATKCLLSYLVANRQIYFRLTRTNQGTGGEGGGGGEGGRRNRPSEVEWRHPSQGVYVGLYGAPHDGISCSINPGLCTVSVGATNTLPLLPACEGKRAQEYYKRGIVMVILPGKRHKHGAFNSGISINHPKLKQITLRVHEKLPPRRKRKNSGKIKALNFP